MRICATSERGFTLLEVVCCVAVIAVGAAATLGALAATARNAENGATRDAALMVAENALARARAAATYVPASQTNPAAAAQSAAWALASTSSYVAGARIIGPALCASGSANLRLAVTTAFDAAHNTFTVSVTYPRDPCAAAGVTATLTLAQTLAPATYVPGTQLVRPVQPPANM